MILERQSTLKESLVTAELAVQDLLKEPEQSALVDLQCAIKEAKSVHSEAKNKRLEFSRLVEETLLSPAMAYEKRMQSVIDAAALIELEKRKKANEDAHRVQMLMAEEARFKSFLHDCYADQAYKFRKHLAALVDETYQMHLLAGTPSSKVGQIKAEMTQLINDATLDVLPKFQSDLLPRERMLEIFGAFDKYDPVFDRMTAIARVNEIYQSYEMDLANAEVAAQRQREIAEASMKEEEQKHIMDKAINNLSIISEVPEVQVPRVKRELKVVVDESEVWAIAVVGNFTRLLPHLAKYLRVKSWSKLSIGQMADAIGKHVTETGEKIGNLKFEEVCK